MTYELYKKMIKEDLKNLEKSGQVTKDQAVEIALEKLAAIDDDAINQSIKKYRADKDEYIKQAKELQDKFIKVVDDVFTKLVEDL